MNADTCRLKLRKVFTKDVLSDEMLTEIVGEAENIKKQFPDSFDEKMMEVAAYKMSKMKDEANQKLRTVKEFNKVLGMLNEMESPKFSRLEKAFGLDNEKIRKLEALLDGQAELAKGSNYSISTKQLFYKGFFTNELSSLVRNEVPDVKKIASVEFSRDVTKEIYHLNGGKQGFATTNPLAQKMAKVMHNGYKRMREAFIHLGVDVGFEQNYAGMRRYDVEKVAANKKVFIEMLTGDGVDARTFDPGATMEQKVKRAEEAWNSIVTGKSADPTKHRSIHFSNPDVEVDFLQKFGYYDNVVQSYIAQAGNSGRIAGLMHVLGPDYKTTLDRLVKWTGDEANASRLVSSMIADITGDLYAVKATKVARALQNVRLGESLTKLQTAVISAFGMDHVSMGALAGTVDGRGPLAEFHKATTMYFKNLTDKQRASIAQKMSLASFDLKVSLADEMDGGVKGKMSDLTEFMFRAQGLTQHSDAIRSTTAAMVGHTLFEDSHLDFNNIPKGLKDTFNRYRITEKDWNIMRKAVDSIDDIKFISVEKIVEQAGLEKSIDTIAKYGSMLNDYARLSTLESTPYSRQMLYWGTQGGTVPGEILRFIGQFKQSQVNLMRQQARLYHSYSMGNYAAIFALSTLAGYMAMVGKQVLVKGQTPEEIDFETTEGKLRFMTLVGESMGRGAGGIIMDTVTAPYHQEWRNITTDIAGPVASDMNKFVKLAAGFSRGNIDENSTEAVHFMRGLIPFTQGAVIKPVLDGLIFDNVHNMVNSNYEVNARRKLEQRGQKRIKDVIF